jgi:hypothetical protein
MEELEKCTINMGIKKPGKSFYLVCVCGAGRGTIHMLSRSYSALQWGGVLR